MYTRLYDARRVLARGRQPAAHDADNWTPIRKSCFLRVANNGSSQLRPSDSSRWVADRPSWGTYRIKQSAQNTQSGLETRRFKPSSIVLATNLNNRRYLPPPLTRSMHLSRLHATSLIVRIHHQTSQSAHSHLKDCRIGIQQRGIPLTDMPRPLIKYAILTALRSSQDRSSVIRSIQTTLNGNRPAIGTRLALLRGSTSL